MRKRPLLLLLVIPLVLSGVLWEIKCKRDAMAVVTLSRYPQDPNFGLSAAAHLKQWPNPLWISNTNHSLLLTTYFVGGNMNKVQWGSLVDTGATETILATTHWRPLKNGGTFSTDDDTSYTNRHSLQLKWGKMKFLRSSLSEMPLSDAPKLRGDLLLVSFEDGGGWQTRVFDKKALPNRVKQVLALTGQKTPLP